MKEGAPRDQGRHYYRDRLRPQGQAIYDQMEKRFLGKDYYWEFQFPIEDHRTFVGDASGAYRALRDDHPEFFFLGNEYEMTRRGSQGGLRCQLLYAPVTIERINLQLRRKICQLVRGTAFLPLAEQERMVYERIAKSVVYDDQNDHQDHNVVGPILHKSGVCEGYNALLLLCFRRLRIPCIKTFGKMDAERETWHCWTKAWMGDREVHCDVTWDAPVRGRVMYQYFNLSEDEIRKDHVLARIDEEGKLCISPSLEIPADRNGSGFIPVPAGRIAPS